MTFPPGLPMREVPGRRGAGGMNAPSRADVPCRRTGIVFCERLHVAVPDSLVCFRYVEFWRLGECNVGSETPRLSVAEAILSIL